MGRMVRKQMYLDEGVEHELELAAARLGLSQAEIMRRALERFLADQGGESLALRRLKEHWAKADELGIGGFGKWDREKLHERPGDRRRY